MIEIYIEENKQKKFSFFSFFRFESVQIEEIVEFLWPMPHSNYKYFPKDSGLPASELNKVLIEEKFNREAKASEL